MSTERYHMTHVDAAPYVAVLNQLRRRHSLKEIARTCKLSRWELTQLSTGKRTMIRPSTVERLREGLLDEKWYR